MEHGAGDAELSAFGEVLLKHFVNRLTVEIVAPEVVDAVPGRVAVVDLKTDLVDDIDLLCVVKSTAEADEHRVKSRALDSLKCSSRIGFLFSCVDTVFDHSNVFLVNVLE